MGDNTAIQWTDVTDNIIRVKGGGWWCRMISEGCVNCYAAKLNQNAFYGGNKLAYTGAAPELILMQDIIDGWAKKTKSRKHFVSSMTDVFGDWVKREWIFAFLDGMAAAPKQTFQVLTKRADVMACEVTAWLLERRLDKVPSNIWLGVSVENQKCADERIPLLLSIPSVHFLSVEPMLGSINLERHLWDKGMERFWPKKQGEKIDWVIFGFESGHNARPGEVDWIRGGVKQCQAAGVKCFVKQIGRDPQWSDKDMEERWYEVLSHPKGGNMNEWPHDLRVREFPEVKP